MINFFSSTPLGVLVLLAIGWGLGELVKYNHWFGF